MTDKARIYEGYNLMILIPVILLIALGLLMVYSASNNLCGTPLRGQQLLSEKTDSVLRHRHCSHADRQIYSLYPL